MLTDATEEPAAVEADDGDAPDADGARWVFRAALGLALAPLVVSAIHQTFVVGGDYVPVGDLAMIEVVTRDVGHRWVQIGPFSRDGWHHPGPVSYYLFAVPYRLLGSASTAMNVAALLINGASVAGIGLLARRRGGIPLAVMTLLGLAVLIRALGPELIRTPWNPYVTNLPYALLLFLAWSLACRDRWALPVAVGVASFLAQTHVAFVPLALPFLGLGAVALVVATLWVAPTADRPRWRSAWTTLRWPLVTSAAVAALAWIGPLVEQVREDPGNASLIADYFRTGGPTAEQPRGIGVGWRFVTAQYGVAPEWVLGARPVGLVAEPPSVYDAVLPVLLVVIAAAIVVLWRRRVPGAPALAAVWTVGVGTGVIATARVVGPVFAYRVGWTWALGMVGTLLVAWAAWELVARSRAAVQRAAAGVALGALAVLAVMTSVAHVDAGVPYRTLGGPVREVVPGVVDALPEGEGPVVIERGGNFEALGASAGIFQGLEHRGIDAAFPRSVDRHPGIGYTDGGPARARIVVDVGADIVATMARPDVELIAYAGTQTLDEITERVETDDLPLAEGSGLAVFLVTPP